MQLYQYSFYPTLKVTALKLMKFQATHLVDHSVMENLHHFQPDYEAAGGTVKLVGLEMHEPVSSHNLAACKRKKALAV
jgi:hypothetical protein